MNHPSPIVELHSGAGDAPGTDATTHVARRRFGTVPMVIGAVLACVLAASTPAAPPAHGAPTEVVSTRAPSASVSASANQPAPVDAASVETLLRGMGVVSDQPGEGTAGSSAGPVTLEAPAGESGASSVAPSGAPSVAGRSGAVPSGAVPNEASTATLSAKSGLSVRTGAAQVQMRPIAAGAAKNSPGGLAVYGNGEQSAFALSTSRTGANAGYSVIAGSEAPTKYSYLLFVNGAPAALTLTPEGGVDVLDATGNVVNSIAPAWATDASGAAVPSSYSAAGNVLTQHVEHSGAVYPVVADPRFRCDGLWCTVELSRYETRLMAAGALSPGIACRFLGPGAGICAGLLIGGWAQANIAVNSGQCIGIRVWQRNLFSYLHLSYVRCYA